MRLAEDSVTTTMGLLMNTDAGTVEQVRNFINSTGQWVIGHGASAQITQALGLSNNEKVSLAIRFDGTTLTAFKNGVQIASAAAPAVDQTRGLFLGAQTAAAANPLIGDIQFAAIYSAALTNQQILELHNATYT